MKPTPDLFTTPTAADHVLKLADLLDGKANLETQKALVARQEGTAHEDHEKRAKSARFYAAACRTLVEENKGLTKRMETRTKRGQFVAPSLPEIRSYAGEIKLPDVEATRFFNFFSSKGWKVGNAGMVDWKAALRNWRMSWAEKNSQPSQSIEQEPTGWSDFLKERSVSYMPYRSAPAFLQDDFRKKTK